MNVLSFAKDISEVINLIAMNQCTLYKLEDQEQCT